MFKDSEPVESKLDAGDRELTPI